MKKRTPQRSAAPSLLQGEQRINKILAAAGLGSRRQVDELIEQGRVEVDGKAIQQVGVKINPETAVITVDGEPLRKHRPVYFALHKPEGVLCTNRDPQGRMRVVDMVPNQFRLFPVGRLDASSTGLILLTNDGELSQRLTHPRHGVTKRYAVTVVGQVEADSLRRLQRGIHLAEGRAKVDHAKLKRVRKGCTELEITLSEGKNREIRRVLARLGHKVVSLKRIGIGPLKLGELPEGAYRPLGMSEVESLYSAVEAIKRERKQERKERKKASEGKPNKPATQKVQRSPKFKNTELEESEYEESDIDENEFLVEEVDGDERIDGSEEGILVRETEGDVGGDDDWGPPVSQRLGAVIGDEEFASEKEPQRAKPKQVLNRGRDKRGSATGKSGSGKSRPGSPRAGKTRTGSPRAERSGLNSSRNTSRSGGSSSRTASNANAGSRSGASKPSKPGRKMKPREESTPSRGGERESFGVQQRPSRPKKGGRKLPSAGKRKTRNFSGPKPKRRGK
jgi:23S rRNA pseudouridine2605 synthase